MLASIYINVLVIPEAREEGRELERAAALERSMQIIRQRSTTDAEIGRMSDGDLCREIGGVWLSVERTCQRRAGFAVLTPSVETRAFIIANDLPFAEDVAVHNRTSSALPACRR